MMRIQKLQPGEVFTAAGRIKLHLDVEGGPLLGVLYGDGGVYAKTIPITDNQRILECMAFKGVKYRVEVEGEGKLRSLHLLVC